MGDQRSPLVNEVATRVENLIRKHLRIGVMISGGMDSALLSYLLMYYRRKLNTGCTLEFVTVPRTDDSWVHASRVLNYLKTLYGDQNIRTHCVGDPTLVPELQTRSGLLIALKELNVQVMVMGSNAHPPHMPGGPPRPPSKSPRIVLPFQDLTKDQLVQTYIAFGLHELMTQTHTCTESTLLRCCECWQCRERAWAFSQCNYTDPGTM